MQNNQNEGANAPGEQRPEMHNPGGRRGNQPRPQGQRRPNNARPPPPPNRPMPGGPPPANAQVRDGNPFAESIFGRGVTVREVRARTTFTPSLVALPTISRSVFRQLITDDLNLSKELLPQYLDYYHTFLLWLRILNLKDKNQAELTPMEERVLDATRNREYSVLEPISIFLKGIGNITTMSGQKLYPQFPVLPTNLVEEQPGFFGRIDRENHNLYEEIPCLGVLAEAIRHAISNDPVGPYGSVLNTQNTIVNDKLLGYRNLQNRRNDAKNLALNANITADVFVSTYPNTAINIELLHIISDVLADTKTFKVHKINFSTLSEVGSQAQIIETRAQTLADEFISDINAETISSCLFNEKPQNFGASTFCNYQLFKTTHGLDYSRWCCVTPVAGNIIPPEWNENRDIRRNLPAQYHNETFRSIAQNSNDYRLGIIQAMVLTKR